MATQSVRTTMEKASCSFEVWFEGVSGYPEFVASPEVTFGEYTWKVLYFHGNPGIILEKVVGPDCRLDLSVKCLKVDGTVACSSSVAVSQQTEALPGKSLPFSQSPPVINDKVHLVVDINVYSSVELSEPITLTPRSGPLSRSDLPSEKRRRLSTDVAQLFGDVATADVTVRMNDNSELRAHKTVLCMRSAVFRTMFTVNMSEAAHNVIQITDFEPAAVAAFIRFLYLDHLRHNHLECYAHDLLELGRKYLVDGLVSQCEDHILKSLSAHTVLDTLSLATLHNSTHLQDDALLYLLHNSDLLIQQETFAQRLHEYLACKYSADIVNVSAAHQQMDAQLYAVLSALTGVRPKRPITG